MPEYVRVSDKETRHHYSIPRERYELSPELWDLLKSEPATAPSGEPMPPTYKTPDASPASAKQAGSSANTDKEHS